MKKVLVFILVLALAFSTLTACAGNKHSPSTDTTPATSGTEEKSSEEKSSDAAPAEGSSDEKTVVTILSAYITENPQGPIEQSYADAYMAANPNIKIEFTGINSNDVYTKVVTLANSNDLPVLFYGGPSSYSVYSEMDIIADMKPYFDQEFLDSLYPGVLEENSVDGKMVSFPCDLQPNAVLYRIDRFEEAGLKIPTTWEEFLDCAIKLTKDTDNDGKVDQWGFSMVGTNNGSGQGRFKYYLYTHGLELIYKEGDTWVTDVDSEKFAKAFTFWTDFNNKHGVVPTGITEVAYDTAANYFAMGYTSMMISGGNALGVAYDVNPELKGKIGTFKLPGEYPGCTMGSEGYVLTKSATEAQAKAAAGYLKWFVTEDKDMQFWQKSGKLPVTKDGLNSDYLKGPDYAGFLEAIKNTRPIDTFPGTQAFNGLLGDAYSAVFSGEATNEEALKTLIEGTKELLEEFK